MKRFLLAISIAAFTLLAGCSYDDNDLWDKVNDLDERLTTLEDKLNGEISAIRQIVDALDNGKYITDVTETADGYTISFSDGTSASLNHGKDGTDGVSGSTPIVGVEQDTDGVYYWTITVDGVTEWMTDSGGNKVRVTGESGSDGQNGTNGSTPVMGVDAQGYWTVTIDGVTEQVKDADGNPVKAEGQDGDTLIRSIEVTAEYVKITLMSGGSFTLPIMNFSLIIDSTSTEVFDRDETRTFNLTMTNIESTAINKPDGWKASISGATLTVTAPAEANLYAEENGYIAITATSKNYATIVKMSVRLTEIIVVTFEDADPGFLAGPTSYGGNLYSTSGDDQVFGYYDNASDLMLVVNEAYGSYDMWNGATFLSQWNDMTASGYTNQCSVYYSDPTTGFGGYNGSQTFGVSYGYTSSYAENPQIFFLDDDAEYVIDHMYVINNTYAVLSMMYGDSFAKVFSYADEDWFKLTCEGFDKNGTSTGTVEILLADFTTASSPGIITEWIKLDMSALGKVHTVKFDMTSSDSGDYGMNTPAYFCFDDITILR